jgi:Putative prokaryotic signal transducing protein
LKTVRTYQNPGEAGFAQSLLESSGIAAVLEHETSASIESFGAISARLCVPDEQVPAALKILADHPVQFATTPARSKVHFSIGNLLAFSLFLVLLLIVGSSWQLTLAALVIVLVFAIRFMRHKG